MHFFLLLLTILTVGTAPKKNAPVIFLALNCITSISTDYNIIITPLATMPTQPTTEEALTDEQLSELLQETERMYLSGQITSTDYREFLLRSMNQMVSMPPVPNAGMPSDMAARLDTVHHVLARQRALSGPGYHLTMTSLAVLMTLSELQVVKLMQRIWPLNGRLGVSFDLFAAQFQNLARICLFLFTFLIIFFSCYKKLTLRSI